jgi:hypothetical protein
VIRRSISLHGALFVAAAALGLRVWTAEDEPNKKAVAAELWSGRISDLQRIEFRTDKKLVSIEPKEDTLGRYYVGSTQNLKPPPTASTGADAGAPTPAAAAVDETPKRFISSSKSDDLAKSLVTLKASRVLGKLNKERLGEFGLEKNDQGTLEVVLAGKKHTLTLGEKTPGGSDRYVQNPETGEAYVIAGSIANDLQSADSRLVERDFHDFGDVKIVKVVLRAGDKSREIVRHAEEKDFWSHPESPETKDETVSNWMTKIDRLKVTNYVEALEPAAKPEDQVVRVEYQGEGGKQLGYLELLRRASADPKEKTEYLARSEHSRWYATVLRSTGEQIDQDLASVLTP